MADEWEARLQALRTAKDRARGMGGPDRLAARAGQGLRSAREWIDRLCDPGTFVELGLLAGGDIPADAMLAGFGAVDGRPVLVGAEDFTVKGGSLGAGSSAKRHRLAQLAGQERVPLVMLLEGAGARVEADARRLPRIPYDIQEYVRLSGKVPFVCGVMGTSAGHGAMAAPISDFVVMAETGQLFSGGPPLVKAAIGEEVSKEDLGGPDIHTVISGVAHNRADDHDAVIDTIRRYLSFFPSNAWEAAPLDVDGPDHGPRLLDDLTSIIPTRNRQPYDVRDVIERMVDEGDYFEVGPDYGASMVCALARMGGEPVAVVANQPMVMGGAITVAAAEKGAHFISVADCFHLPLILLTDNPGVLPGTASEQAGILRAGTRMLAAQSGAQTAKIHVTLGKAYGFGAAIMGKVPFDQQTLCLALPGGELGAMPAAVGAKLAKQDTERVVADVTDASFITAERFAIDDLIEPAELRNAVLAGLRLSAARRRGPLMPVARTGVVV